MELKAGPTNEERSDIISTMCLWPQQSQVSTLLPNEVHVWCISMDVFTHDHIARMRAWLSDEERKRADNLHHANHRKCFVISHGMTRRIVGHYTNTQPQKLEFSCYSHGKPRLCQQRKSCNVEFNLSHSGQLALLAVSCDHPLGLDIEQINPAVNISDITGRFFTQEECAFIMSLPTTEQTTVFYKLWTCKEALIKGIGTGLTLALDSFTVSFDKDQPVIRSNESEYDNWSLRCLKPASGYAASIAVHRKIQNILTWQWPKNPYNF